MESWWSTSPSELPHATFRLAWEGARKTATMLLLLHLWRDWMDSPSRPDPQLAASAAESL